MVSRERYPFYGRCLELGRTNGTVLEKVYQNSVRLSKINQKSLPLWLTGSAFTLLGLLIYAPYLGFGFAADDFIFISALEGALPFEPVWGFWYGEEYHGFSSIWWSEPAIDGSFLRPLASWVLMLHYWAFGRNTLPYHLTLIFLHGQVAFTTFLVLRRLSRNNLVALLAASLFLICEDHSGTVAWIATITDLMCALFLNLAFLCHIIAREHKNKWLFGLSLILAVAAVLSKETAIVYPLVVALFEFFFANRLANYSGVTRSRVRYRLFLRHGWAWITPLLIFGVYFMWYRGMVPPMRSLLYTDPLHQPARYLGQLVVNLPVMAVSLLTQWLPSLTIALPHSQVPVTIAGLVLLFFLLWALLPYRQEQVVWFSFAIFLVGLLPGLGTAPGERLLYFSSTYGFLVVAWLIVQLPFLRWITPDAPPGVPILGSFWGWYLLVEALVIPIMLLFVYPSIVMSTLQLPERTMLKSLPLISENRHEHVVYLNTNSSANTIYLPEIYRYYRGQYVDLRLLSSFNGHVQARQEGARTLTLRSEDEGWLDNLFARVVRVTPAIYVGDIYTTPLFTATVLAVTPDGRDAQRVCFEFALPLNDPSLLLLYYDGTGYRRWQPTPDWVTLNPTTEPLAF